MDLDEKLSEDMSKALKRIEDNIEITGRTREEKHKDVEDL